MKKVLLLISFVFTFVHCQSSPLYIIGVPIPDTTYSTTESGVLLQIDVMSNTTTEVMKFNYTDDKNYIVSSTFDQDNDIYYFIHTTYHLLNTTTYLSAINVNTKEFVIQNLLFSEYPVYWGIDLDTNSKIHYLRRISNRAYDFKHAVDYCVFDLNSQTTIPIVSAAALIPESGSLVYVESNTTVLISNSMNGITSIGLGNYVTQLPTVNAIAYPSILWNKQTNQGYLISLTEPETSEFFLNVLKYVPISTNYPLVCSIPIPSTWEVATDSDIGSIDPVNNLITLVFTHAETQHHRKMMNALLTINLNSCEYSWIEFSHGNEYILIGPQFSY